MHKNFLFNNFWVLFVLLVFGICQGQHHNTITATLDGDKKEIKIQQKYEYVNTSKDTLTMLYFNDWANAYSDKGTALAKRFAEEFKKSLHLAKKEERGRTDIHSIISEEYEGLTWERTSGKDIIKVNLVKPLAPNTLTTLVFTYTIKLPPNKYTPYGYNNRGGYYLKDWYLSPAIYDGEWQLYSNKNLEDLYTEKTSTLINFSYPDSLTLASNFSNEKPIVINGKQEIILESTSQKNCEIIISPTKKFNTHITPTLTIVTDLEASRYDEISQGISVNKVAKYLTDQLGYYPHKHLLVSNIDYNKNPLYGINQLPSFVRPYEEQFQFELKFLKTAINSYLRETIYINPRKEKWVTDAIANYLMINYVDTYYKDYPLMGKLSNLWGFRKFRLAKMKFNDQYPFLYMLSARKNLNQPLVTSNDSLLWFNQKIANKYKAGLGLDYLAEYAGKENINKGIRNFYNTSKLKNVTALDFEAAIDKETDTDIKWFFTDYVSSRKKIDFTIDKVYKDEDSVSVVIRNKTGTNVPISLYGLKNDSIVYKRWLSNIETKGVFTVPRNGADKMVLNYEQKVPEINQRDNWKTLNGFLSRNKKFKLQFFQDAEEPFYNQVFYVPVASFNLYDGLTPGLRLHNKTLLKRPFVFDLAPSYSFGEKSFVGYGRFSYNKQHNKGGLYVSNYSISGSTFHFQANSRYSKITPSISFGWRPDDLRSNKRQALSLRYINILRSVDENLTSFTQEEPDYSVLNARYINSNRGIINYISWFADAQYAKDFSKVSFNLEYRKLFENNRQFNLRFFAGKFIQNKTNSDYFNFALDRPTDYLFDYGYLGRSEDTGIYSQQIIIAEGGFKSKLDNPFSNDWMTTMNTSFNIWRWIELYGDVGVIKNRGFNERFVYDSGVRLNLVTDYFELYLPLYSNNGWEVAQPNYEEKIRFIVTLSPKTLIGLFTRKWF